MADYIPKPDAEAAVFLRTMADRLVALPGSYDLTVPEADGLNELVGDFEQALRDSQAAQLEASNRVANKVAARAAAEERARALVQRIQVAPIVTDQNRLLAGIPVRDDTRSFNAPTPPQALQVMPDAAGFNSLKWEPGNNEAGARYVIEARIGAAPEFAVVDVVTATTYKHQGRTPGQPVIYRVLARRGEVVSQPSNTASVYQ